MSLDIHTGIQTAIAITLLALVLVIWRGIANIRKARSLPFFRMRRQTMVRGWRYILLWVPILIILAILLNTRAEPLAYSFFPPTAFRTFSSKMVQAIWSSWEKTDRIT